MRGLMGLSSIGKGIPFFLRIRYQQAAKIDPQSMAIVEYKLRKAPGAARCQWTRAIRFISRTIKAEIWAGSICDRRLKMWPSPGANSGPYGIAITLDGMVCTANHE